MHVRVCDCDCTKQINALLILCMSPNKQIQAQGEMSFSSSAAPAAAVVDLIGSESDDGAEDPHPAAALRAPPASSHDDDCDGDLRRALELSKEAAEAADAAAFSARHDEDADLLRVLELSKKTAEAEAARPTSPFTIPACCLPRRTLTKDEFRDAIRSVADRNGGLANMEEGSLVKTGNSRMPSASSSQDCEEGVRVHHRQTRAQYGRYTIEAFWRLLDRLERGDYDREGNGGGGSRIRKKAITAFVDIGHGLGIQVLQCGLGLGVPSRGVEIMSERHLIADVFRTGLPDALPPGDRPDLSHIELRCADFTKAVLPPPGEEEKEEEDEKGVGRGSRDNGLRDFLLCRDLDATAREGMVLFANNACEIFAGRSNNGRDPPLDAHLAELFGNLPVGGRLVTLEDVSGHLHRSANWYSTEVLDSGPDAVTWGSDSVEVYVLTKLADSWTCRNEDCDTRKFGEGAATNVLDGNGRLGDACVYCGGGTERTLRDRGRKRGRGDDNVNHHDQGQSGDDP